MIRAIIHHQQTIMEKLIKQIVEDAIPLDMTCEIKRREQLRLRAKLRLDIEELLRSVGYGRPGPQQLK